MPVTPAWVDASIPGSPWEVQFDLKAETVTYRHRTAGTDESWRDGKPPAADEPGLATKVV